MGDCVHCGKPAGLFRSSHPTCAQEKREALAKAASEQRQKEHLRAAIEADVHKAMLANTPAAELDMKLAEHSERLWLTTDERIDIVARGWIHCVDAALEDGILTDDEIQHLEALITRFNLPAEKLQTNNAISRLGEAVVLRSVMEGDPKFIDPPSGLNLRKGEGVVWVFYNVDFLEDRVRRKTVGGSQGMSFRIAKGVYYRVGGFKAESVATTERVLVDNGYLAVTNAALYFVSATKSVRVPYNKIVSFDQFKNAIGIMRDAQTAKPQIFVTGDGWFSYNLIVNLAQL